MYDKITEDVEDNCKQFYYTGDIKVIDKRKVEVFRSKDGEDYWINQKIVKALCIDKSTIIYAKDYKSMAHIYYGSGIPYGACMPIITNNKKEVRI